MILGQGMLAAGWHAHTLDAPGKFLLSAPGLDQPRRARGYLLTDPDVETTARRHAAGRPHLDPLSTAAAIAAGDVIDAEVDEATGEPEALLWTALRTAPPGGHSISALMNITGMGRTWIYDRLQQHADASRVTQVTLGRWRATIPDTDAGTEP